MAGGIMQLVANSSLTGVTLTATSGNPSVPGGTQTIPVSSLSVGANSVQITPGSSILTALQSGATINYSLSFSYADGKSVVSTAGTPYTIPLPPSIVTSGLILNYNIGNNSSYSGTGATITDLQGNSNATTLNNPSYTSTGGGYLTFNGINHYLITNTSLASKLSPPITSKVISIFLWIYPMDNGVIVTELGSAAINTLWYANLIEMVAGSLRFSVWPNGRGFASTIPTPYNAWYYVGLTYSGNTLKAYVNGQPAGTGTNYSRDTPGEGLHYSVAAMGSTNLGDGTPANMRFGGMQVYNIALTDSNVLTNYDAQKSRFGLS
jgi:hypothetical protein